MIHSSDIPKDTRSTSPYATLARRAIRASRAAKVAGDERLSAYFGAVAAQAIDAHLATLRVRPS